MRIKACVESFSLFPAVMEIVVCEGGLEVVVDRVGGGCYRHVDSDSGLGGTKLGDDVYGINDITTPRDVRWKYASLAVRKLETRGEAGAGVAIVGMWGIRRARVLSAALPAQMG